MTWPPPPYNFAPGPPFARSITEFSFKKCAKLDPDIGNNTTADRPTVNGRRTC